MFSDKNGVAFLEPEKDTMDDLATNVNIMQSQTSSLFGKRQGYSYVWPNLAARDATTGMTPGAKGYQVDTQVEYIYGPAGWKDAEMESVYIVESVGTGSILNRGSVASLMNMDTSGQGTTASLFAQVSLWIGDSGRDADGAWNPTGGQLRVTVNDVVVRNRRWHSHSHAQTWLQPALQFDFKVPPAAAKIGLQVTLDQASAIPIEIWDAFCSVTIK